MTYDRNAERNDRRRDARCIRTTPRRNPAIRTAPDATPDAAAPPITLAIAPRDLEPHMKGITDMTDKSDIISQLQAKQEEVEDRGKIDPISAVGAIMVVSDAMDIDPLQVIRDIKGGARRFGEGSPEQVILDLIEISQSNFDMAVNDLEEFFALEADIAAATD